MQTLLLNTKISALTTDFHNETTESKQRKSPLVIAKTTQKRAVNSAHAIDRSIDIHATRWSRSQSQKSLHCRVWMRRRQVRSFLSCHFGLICECRVGKWSEVQFSSCLFFRQFIYLFIYLLAIHFFLLPYGYLSSFSTPQEPTDFDTVVKNKF